MHHRTLVPLLLTAVLASGCSEAREAVGAAGGCAALATDVARSGLSGVPAQAEAEQAVQRLDERVQSLDDGPVRDAAVDLRERLRELQEAARSSDPVAVQQAAGRARDAAEAVAQACSLPVSRFLG